MKSILDLREERVRYQTSLEDRFQKTLLVIRPNQIGPDKRNLWSNYASYVAFREVKERFSPLHLSYSFTEEGLIFYLILDETLHFVKQLAMQVEDQTPLGRLVDIDVYHKGQSLSRQDLDHSPRACFLCDQPAVICTRIRAHSATAIDAFIRSQVKSYITDEDPTRLRIVEFCLFSEVTRTISLGCVTPLTNGSHQDMDYRIFLTSLDRLSREFLKIRSLPSVQFSALRNLGLELETAMHEATNDVNTHKGVIFIFLLVLGAFMNDARFEYLSRNIANLSRPCLKDLKLPDDSHGREVYNRYGTLGVRGEAASGFVRVFESYLPFFDRYQEIDRLFLHIAQDAVDTNALFRAGPACYEELKKLLSNNQLELAEEHCRKHNISTGGSADLVSLTILVYFIREHHQRVKEVLHIEDQQISKLRNTSIE